MTQLFFDSHVYFKVNFSKVIKIYFLLMFFGYNKFVTFFKKEEFMDFLELAKERYSVRKFSDKKIEKEKIDLILEAARISPTACNLQPQRIIVLDSEESMSKLRNCTAYHFDAPLAMLICYDRGVSWKRKYDGKDGGEVDAAIVTTQMMLEIANLGLGTTWVGSFDPAVMSSVYHLPENIVPIALLPIGYPADDSVPHPNHDSRLELEKTVFYNSLN